MDCSGYFLAVCCVRGGGTGVLVVDTGAVFLLTFGIIRADSSVYFFIFCSGRAGGTGVDLVDNSGAVRLFAFSVA